MIVFNIVILVVQQEKRIDVTPFPVREPLSPAPGEILVTCEKCGWKNHYAEIPF
jgi:RNase P subunit RPR2